MSISQDFLRRQQNHVPHLHTLPQPRQIASAVASTPSNTSTTSTSTSTLNSNFHINNNNDTNPNNDRNRNIHMNNAPPASAVATAAAVAATMNMNMNVAAPTTAPLQLPLPPLRTRTASSSSSGTGRQLGTFNSKEFGKLLSREFAKFNSSTSGSGNPFLSKDAPLPAFNSGSSIFRSKDSFSSIFSSKDWEMKYPIEAPKKEPLPPLKTMLKNTASALTARNSSVGSVATSVLPDSAPVVSPVQAERSTTAAAFDALMGGSGGTVPTKTEDGASSPSLFAFNGIASKPSSSSSPLMDFATQRSFTKRFTSKEWLPLQTLGPHVDIPIRDDIFERQSSTSSIHSTKMEDNILDALPPSTSANGSGGSASKFDWQNMFLSQLQPPSPTYSPHVNEEDPGEAEPDPPDPAHEQQEQQQQPDLAYSFQGIQEQQQPQSEVPLTFDVVPLLKNQDDDNFIPSLEREFALDLLPQQDDVTGVQVQAQEQTQTQTQTEVEEEVEAAPANEATTGGTKKRKRRPRKKVVPEVKVYVEPNQSDVLLGRGGRSNHHPGNKRYREEVKNLQRWYNDTADKTQKTDLSQTLVDFVHSCNGRFLEKDANGWYIVANIVARRKASQALREDDDPQKRAAKRARYLAKKKRMEEEAAKKGK